MLPPLQGAGRSVSLTSLPTSEMTRLCLETDEPPGPVLSGLWDGRGHFALPEQLHRLLPGSRGLRSWKRGWLS